MQAFLQEYDLEKYKEFIPSKFIKTLQTLAKRKRFEEIIMRDDIVEYFSNKSKEELEREFGTEVARMKDFDQMNPHHCYDLLGHTLHTVDGIKRDGLTPEQYKELRISAFLHDIGKPEVARMHPKIKGQQVFYGHAERSATIARKMLSDMGYDKESIDRISFYIGHHDDFISYKAQDQITPAVANHEFIRGITPETVAEIMFQNEYNSIFQKNGYSKDQIRYICYALAHGKEPNFEMGGRKIKIDASMRDALGVVQEQSGYSLHTIRDNDTYQVIDWPDKYSLQDYQMLLNLCRADANAQAKTVEMQGKQVSSRQEKIANMDTIASCLPEAKRTFDLVKLSNLFLGNIAQSSPTQEVIGGKISGLSPEALYYLEEYGDTPWHNHTSILNWVTLTGKSPEFLGDMRKKIEKQKYMTLTDEVDVENFEELYAEDLKDLDRIKKARTRKERVQPLEEQLSAEEKEETKIRDAEKLLIQVNKEKQEEGR